MLKTVVTAAIVLAATAAPAFAAETWSFTRDGKTFVYSKVVANGRVIVEGRNDSGETFHLTIVGTRVTGISNGVPVSFVMSTKGAASTQVAAR